MTMNALTLIAFTRADNFYALLFCRFATGFMQVFQTVYFPVWSDSFGSTEKQKTMWLTLLLLCAPIGVLIGYLLGAWMIGQAGWRYAFYVQAVLYIPAIIIFFFTPVSYLDSTSDDEIVAQPEEGPLVPMNPRASLHEFAF